VNCGTFRPSYRFRDRIQNLRGQLFPKVRPKEKSTERKNLENWRNSQALAADVKPGDVISDEAIEQLISRKPSTTDQLEKLTHLNSFKIARYGDDLIRILSNENGTKA